MLLKTFVSSYKLGNARILLESSNTEFYIRLYNPEDHAIAELKHTEVALLGPVAYVSQPICDKRKVIGTNCQELPEYLKPVYENVIANLNSQESEKFNEFLIGEMCLLTRWSFS